MTPAPSTAFCEVPDGLDAGMEFDAREVLRVEAAVAHLLEDVGLDAPGADGVAVGGEDLGDGGAHVAGAEDGDRFGHGIRVRGDG